MMFWRALRAEVAKLKRGRVLFPVLLAPVLILVLQYLNFLVRYDQVVRPGDRPWTIFVAQHMTMWAVLMLPVLAAVLASMVSGVEHSNNHWKHVLALPVRREHLYLAKLLLVYLLLIASTAVLGLGMLISAALLSDLGEMPGWQLPKMLIAPLLGIVAVLTIQLWLSTRSHNEAVPLAVGVCGTILAVFFAQSPLTRWFPWVYPWLALPVPLNDPSEVLTFMLASAAVGSVCLLAGLRDFVRRDV